MSIQYNDRAKSINFAEAEIGIIEIVYHEQTDVIDYVSWTDVIEVKTMLEAETTDQLGRQLW